MTIASAEEGRFVAVRGETGYGADAKSRAGATAFHLKPVAHGTYLIQDAERRLVADDGAGGVGHTHIPGVTTEWAIRGSTKRSFTIASKSTGAAIVIGDGGELTLAGPMSPEPGAGFDLEPRRRCARYPEAKVGASGPAFRGTNPNGTVFGFADAHLHVTANLRAGGRVIHGQSFHPYGIPEALGHDEDDHGPDGTLDVTGNLLRDGSPVGTHDTHGWPSFAGWPVHDTITHQQAYYMWLKRSWKAGLRVLVAQAVEDEALCELEPIRSHSCDETETVKLAIDELRRLEAYVDAQSGGRGRGWFRIVTTPGEARRAVERGKLAVLIGMETSSPFGCGEFMGEAQCTREDVDRVLGELHALGVRSVFIAHWVDNAFSGVALQSGAQGQFISTFQTTTTGQPFATQPCGEADEADGECNSKGLTDLGRYLIEQMMERGMLIEADHLSQIARADIFEIAEENDYPLVSSHTDTGGEWTPDQLARLAGIGGLSAATPEVAPRMAEKILRLREEGPGRRGAVALGSDTGGFASLPGPREDAASDSLAYPFTSYDGRVTFSRQRTGERYYDLNTDGVAHHGLFADLIADIAGQPGGRPALRALFRSAEGYLRMWERAEP